MNTSLRFMLDKGQWHGGLVCQLPVLYHTFNSCASDQNGVNWFFQNGEQFTMNACGSETPTISTVNSTAYPGYGYLFDSCGEFVLNTPYFFGQDFSTSRGDEITLAMNASQTGYVFGNNTNQFMLNIPNYENAVHYTAPTYLWNIDNTCTDAIVMYPRFGTLTTSAFTMPNNNVTLMRDASFSSDWTFDAKALFGGTFVSNVGGSFNSGTLHTGLIGPNQDTVVVTSAMLSLSGWGSGTTIGFASGTRPAFAFSIVNETGASANPTVTIDMSTWGFTLIPFIIHSPRGSATITTADWTLTNITATSATWQYNGTPA